MEALQEITVTRELHAQKKRRPKIRPERLAPKAKLTMLSGPMVVSKEMDSASEEGRSCVELVALPPPLAKTSRVRAVTRKLAGLSTLEMGSSTAMEEMEPGLMVAPNEGAGLMGYTGVSLWFHTFFGATA